MDTQSKKEFCKKWKIKNISLYIEVSEWDKVRIDTIYRIGDSQIT